MDPKTPFFMLTVSELTEIGNILCLVSTLQFFEVFDTNPVYGLIIKINAYMYV